MLIIKGLKSKNCGNNNVGDIMKLFSEVINAMANFLKSEYLSVIVLIITMVILVILLAYTVMQIACKNVINGSAVKYLIAMLFAINLTLSSFEFIFVKNTFITVVSVVAFNVATLIVILLFAFALTVTVTIKEEIIAKKLNASTSKNYGLHQPPNQTVQNLNQTVIGESVQTVTPVTLQDGVNVVTVPCVSVSDYGNGYDGFLDISYLKSLIALLRQKTLSKTDESELDDFEVYLMNFASRQPRQSERVKLSGYLSDFIKKLARYDAC